LKRLLINASNLHVGGGVQVATSFIYELSSFHKSTDNLSVFASNEVDEELNSFCPEKNILLNYEVHDSFGVEFLSNKISRQLNLFKVVFTIFGPLYCWRKPYKSIVGFAQPWIIYPDNECYKMLSYAVRLRLRIKYYIQGIFFKRADILVVELEHVKQRLISLLGIPPERIHVVHNCISSIYLDKSLWQFVNIPKFKGTLRLGYLGRNYLHKNTSIFPEIVANLERIYGINALFYVTFTDQEWADCTPEFRAVCINIGLLSVAQCPGFYQELDAVIFPSLLECFSATPLEAMAMEKPLFVSDRPFNRDICGQYAHYFDPLSPASASASIARVLGDIGPNLEALHSGREYAIQFSSPKERAEKYLDILMANIPT
jgi:glycosyltransferase involved in cell wall biosynthesis